MIIMLMKVREHFSCLLAGNCYIVNTTTFLGDINLVQPIYGYLLPILTLIALFSCSIIMIVLSRPKLLSSSTNVILLSISFCDLLTFICPLPWYMFAYTFENHENMTWTTYSCSLFELSIEMLPQLFHTASIWLTLLLALQRYLYICKVAVAKRMCTTGLTMKIIFGILSVSIVHSLPKILERGYNIVDGNKTVKGTKFYFDVSEEHLCIVKTSAWVMAIGQTRYKNFFYW